ncbi:Cysteine desulfurase [hydrothermal vent metagenome]|uniref:Cysteine desulfurase n=1 Tax=hydrothermal vent metagenome TaxID=652676 RepID=A0A3B0T960_9ZZZZ
MLVGKAGRIAAMLYLDHAATTVMRAEVRDAMAPFLDDVYGNPSGIHGISRRVKNAIEEAREEIAGILGATRPLEIVFTAGGTEADNLAVAGMVFGPDRRSKTVTVATEHEAVLETVGFLHRLGHAVDIVGVDALGRVDLDGLAGVIDTDTAVVSVMAANNETGVIHPIAAISETAHAAGAVMHTDAVQAFISEEVTVAATGADLISLAAHKFGGPMGVGLLYVRNGVVLEPVLHGGGQELGRRSGTLNAAGIVGLATAMRSTVDDRENFRHRVGDARDAFEDVLIEAFPDIRRNAPTDTRLVQHAHLRIPGVRAETLLIRLDQNGLAAAAGSACQSGALDMSHVLQAMGMAGAEADECVRFTFGWVNSKADGLEAARRVIETVRGLQ